MCNECRQHPCHSSCPNAPSSSVVYHCEGCDADIFDGDDCWNINGDVYCEECIDGARMTAERNYY